MDWTNLLSSIINVSVDCHLLHTFRRVFCPLIFPTSLSTGSFASPHPAKEWRVDPPILTAAIPVDAVTANFRRSGGPLSALMIARSRTDFPDPDK